MHLNNLDAATFLRDYWQKKPLLIRNAWDAWHNPLDPDELAGLACEDEVESRLITLKRADWKVEAGPLPGDRFGKLGKAPWTLLVQAVDHHVPDVAALIAPFRFVPNWRIDDVMVSYASDGGGVGPHFDQYDVFLIQGLGRRRWQVGGHGDAACDADTELLPHDDLRLLANFEPVEEWVLEPGDILYVPPRVAHNGVAVGDDCMTYSVGFRAPARSELIAHYADHLLAEIADDDRYADPGLRAQANPGEITPGALAALHAMVTEKLADRDAFARWFGAYNSTPKYPEVEWGPEEPVSAEDIRAQIADGAALRRNPASRFSFVRGADSVVLFVDGEAHECSGEVAAFAEQLCAADQFAVDPELATSEAAVALLTTLFNQGSLDFDQAD
jgi:50S ribosomal protein L16 3-hydroxylase